VAGGRAGRLLGYRPAKITDRFSCSVWTARRDDAAHLSAMRLAISFHQHVCATATPPALCPAPYERGKTTTTRPDFEQVAKRLLRRPPINRANPTPLCAAGSGGAHTSLLGLGTTANLPGYMRHQASLPRCVVSVN